MFFLAATAEAFLLQIDLGDEGVIELSAAARYHRADGSAITSCNLTRQVFEAIRRRIDKAMARWLI